LKKIKSTEAEILGEFIRKCKIAGLKITPQRIAIYKEVLSCSDHPSAYEIYKNLKDAHPNISLDTINRTLLTFAEIGLIQIVEGSGNVRRFDPNSEQHHHLHCIKCGAIIDFYNETYNNLEVPAEIKEKFVINKIRVVLEGTCDKCKRTHES
jgi:Fur family peroxide stress response transcriptional regulator